MTPSTIETTNDLTTYLRQTLPEPKAIAQIKGDEKGGYVSFNWKQRQFVVKKSLEVFEKRGEKLFITAASLLVQSALLSSTRQDRVTESLIDTLRQVEDMLGSPSQIQNGIKLLNSVKSTVAKLARK